VTRALCLALALAVCACGGWESAGIAIKKVAGTIAGTAAEYTACPLGLFDCGHVFQCEGTEVDTPSDYVEICIDDDDQPEQLDEIEAAFGDCSPTPRHVGLCRYCCGADCGRGGNAYSGTWCP
jgi:hypothetical protein